MASFWATLASAAPVAAEGARGNRGSMTLRGVAREAVINLEIPRSSRFAPTTRGLPARRGLELDVPVDRETLDAALRELPDELEYTVRAIEHGHRLRIVHAAAELRWSARLRGTNYQIRIGPESEETRLRKLASRVQQPIPIPAQLGPLLELWHDAEQATSEGDLALARRLWEKLSEHPAHRDLARLRLAELFVISGHINEAMERLRSVSRDHPRSTGAALARLTALQLEAITGLGAPSPGQVVLAATSGDRVFYEAFTWMRTSEVFILMDAADRGLHYFPTVENFPEPLQANAKLEYDRLVAAAVGVPAIFGNSVEAVVQYEAWKPMIDEHPNRADIELDVAEAYLEAGLPRPAIALLRAGLSRRPTSRQEAFIIDRLIEAYHQVDELDHEQEVLVFQLRKHPAAPGLQDRLRAFGLGARRLGGIDGALSRLETVYDAAQGERLRREVLATSADLCMAWGNDAQLVRALERLRAVGYDAEERRAPHLALALARVGRRAEAIPMLRAWIARTTDAEMRDEMGYALALAELAEGRRADGEKILRALATHTSHWGRVARARLRERGLESVVAGLEGPPPNTPRDGANG